MHTNKIRKERKKKNETLTKADVVFVQETLATRLAFFVQ